MNASVAPGVVNSVVSLLRNKERRELEFLLHSNETADRQQVQDKLVAIALKTGNSLVPRKKRSSSRGKTAVFSQASRNKKLKPPAEVLRQRSFLSRTKSKNLFASQRFGLEGVTPTVAVQNGDKKEEVAAAASAASELGDNLAALTSNLSIEQKAEEELKNMRARVDLPKIKHLLPAYDGDMFGTSGNYWAGQLYMARMTPAQEHVKTNRFNFHQETPRYVAKNMEKVDITSKQSACRSICNLTWHSSNALTIIKEGGLSALQEMAETESDGIIQSNCAIAFHNLSRVPEILRKMIENHVVLTIAKAQVKAPNMEPAVILHFLGTLAALSTSKFERGVESRLLQERALDILIFSSKGIQKVRDGPTRPLILAHLLGAQILLNLTTCFDERTTYDQAINVITECISRLSYHLTDKNDLAGIFRVQIQLTQALCNIAGYENNRARMISQGVVATVVKTWDKMKNSNLGYKNQKELDEYRHVAAALVLSLSNCKGELRVTMIRQKSVQLLGDISSAPTGNNKNEATDQEIETRQRCVQALGNLASGGHGDGRAATSVLPAILKLSKNTDPSTRERCARALRDMSERPFSRKLILENGANEVLARLLDAEHVYDSRPTKVKVDCLVAICNLLIYPNTQLSAVSVGTVDVMLTTFERGAGKAEKMCCITIQSLLAVEKARDYVTNNRTLTMLMHLMSNSADATVVEQVTITLAGLVANEGTGKQILDLEGLEIGPIQAFLDIVKNRGEQKIRYSALAALTFLSRVDQNVCHTIVNDGASIIIGAVIGGNGEYEDEEHYVDTETRKWCASLLCELASYAELRYTLIVHGGCAALSILAKTDSAIVQSCTSRAFCYFSDCVDLESTTSDVVASGAVTSLIALSSAHDESTRSNCATALCNLTWGADSEAAKSIVNAGTVNELMILALVRSDSATTKLTCLMALANLLDCGENLEAMVEQGLVWAMTMASSLGSLQNDRDLVERGLALVSAVYSILVRTELGCQRVINEHGGIKAVARLIGSTVEQTSRRGWDILRIMCCRDCQQRLVDEGCLEVLVNMSDNSRKGSSSKDVKEEKSDGDHTVVHNLAALVAFLLRSDDGRSKLVNEAITLLSSMCKMYSGDAEIQTRRYSSEVACRLASDDRTSRIFVVRGGLSHLSDLCHGHFNRSQTSKDGFVYEEYTRLMLVTAFLHVSMHAENVMDMVDSGCLSNLSGLSATTDVAVLEKIVAIVRSLAWQEKNHRPLVHRYHVVRLLCDVMTKGPCTDAMQLDCADAICNLSYHLSTDSYRDMVNDGAIKLLVHLSNHLLENNFSGGSSSSSRSSGGDVESDGHSSTMDMLKLRIAISFCHFSSAGKEFAIELIDQQVLPILIKFIQTRGCPLDLRRDCLASLCSLSFSADDRGDEMIAAGAYDVVTRLSRSSDRFVRKCCGTVLSNLSPFAKDAVSGSVSALLDLCMPVVTDDDDGGTSSKSKTSKLKRKGSGTLISADDLDDSSIPPANWDLAWSNWNKVCKHGYKMPRGVEIIFLQPHNEEKQTDSTKKEKLPAKEEVFWEKTPAGKPVSQVPQFPPAPAPPSIDEICDLENPSLLSAFSSILEEDTAGSSLDNVKQSISVRFPVSEYIFKDQKSGEAHWLNPKTADSWPSGPTGTTPVKVVVQQKALTNESPDDNVSVFDSFFDAWDKFFL
jgi:hypothetical protein